MPSSRSEHGGLWSTMTCEDSCSLQYYKSYSHGFINCAVVLILNLCHSLPLPRTACPHSRVLTCLVIVPMYFSSKKFHSTKPLIYFCTDCYRDFNWEAEVTCSLGGGRRKSVVIDQGACRCTFCSAYFHALLMCIKALKSCLAAKELRAKWKESPK